MLGPRGHQAHLVEQERVGWNEGHGLGLVEEEDEREEAAEEMLLQRRAVLRIPRRVLGGPNGAVARLRIGLLDLEHVLGAVVGSRTE